MEQAASQASAFISLWPLLAHKSPSSLTALEGQGRPQGVIGLEEENFTITPRTGAHH
jgi:hypothetical protein